MSWVQIQHAKTATWDDFEKQAAAVSKQNNQARKPLILEHGAGCRVQRT